jgi:hypothetical protein
MPLWTNVDEEAGKPKNLNATEKAATLGVDADEAGQTAGITHAGWVLKKEGTGGRAGRVSYETLVAMGSMTGDTDSLPPLPVITIDTQPSANTVTDGDPASFAVTASISDADATLSYQWEVSTDSGSSWASVQDADGSGDELSIDPADAEYVTGNEFRVVVSGTNGAVDVTSDEVALTINP